MAITKTGELKFTNGVVTTLKILSKLHDNYNKVEVHNDTIIFFDKKFSGSISVEYDLGSMEAVLDISVLYTYDYKKEPIKATIKLHTGVVMNCGCIDDIVIKEINRCRDNVEEYYEDNKEFLEYTEEDDDEDGEEE